MNRSIQLAVFGSIAALLTMTVSARTLHTSTNVPSHASAWPVPLCSPDAPTCEPGGPK